MSQSKANSARQASSVNAKLNQNLATYVAAAGAAGVSLLAMAPSAEAKVVYTPANQVLTFGTHAQIPLDINGDGIADIYFTGGNTGYNGYVGAGPAAGNGIIGAPGSAAALAWGVRIGPKNQFEAAPELMELQDCKTHCSTQGPATLTKPSPTNGFSRAKLRAMMPQSWRFRQTACWAPQIVNQRLWACSPGV
jgi:hypothetical protein